ncbi:hypothetical protein [Roseibium aggregatum]|uniref:Uncharacterized protein n=1 Tax=Roseibium aggregatum TaxID=187304 RepID=A0A939J2E5_9HYPH|nr:hypothetical protein [Roseibium aggregatum]MBN9671338.1 hypothetical protein [Roseibium aggregatum]
MTKPPATDGAAASLEPAAAPVDTVLSEAAVSAVSFVSTPTGALSERLHDQDPFENEALTGAP